MSFRFLEPIPPRQIVIASGPEGGLYHRHALQYKAALEREGVSLVIFVRRGEGVDKLSALAYTLREHIELVRRAVMAKAAASAAPVSS